ASDGNPNYVGANPPEATTTDAALSNAVTVANSLKSSGTRIVAIGIGHSGGPDALNINNLEAISGTNVDTGGLTADVDTSKFDRLASDLQHLALELCGVPVNPGGGGGGGGGGGNGPPVGSIGSGGGGGGGGGSPAGQVLGASTSASAPSQDGV